MRETGGPVRARAWSAAKKIRFGHADSGQNPDPGRLRRHWDDEASGKVDKGINELWVVEYQGLDVEQQLSG